ncbi:type IV secretory system conjugative DNA transfer family protein [Bradyrhizobium sp. CCGE-LA001]|nr:type IV secretory system conjugative DNA transfer family protein [Bradyrhizobium sp. CCGE-LA001]
MFAPMGAGKGVGIVVPNLLSYEGSIVCTERVRTAP